MSTSVAHSMAPRTRFGLKTLFFLMATVAVVLTPAYWFGPGYWCAVICSATLLACCVRPYYGEFKSGAIGVAVCGALVGFLFLIVSVVFFLHAVVNMIACAMLVGLNVRPKAFAFSLGAVMVVVYGLAIYQGAVELLEVRSVKATYPFESLEPRLAFEKSTSAAEQAPDNSVLFASAVAGPLNEQDELQRAWHRRQWALQQLHEQTYQDFVFTPGFGVSRMPRFRPRMIQLDPLSKFALPIAIGVSSLSAAPLELSRAHRTAVDDFLTPDRIGYVRSKVEVAGFNSHELTNLGSKWANSSQASSKWQVVRLELVSLLRHPEPRVYVAATMPAMDQLATVPHRALNDFESRALPSLVSQQDVVVDRHPNQIQMLGAVRAGKSCLECHEGQRGKLLGAFSYEIAPISDEANHSAQDERPKSETILAGQ